MPALTTAERQFLSQDWRWAQTSDEAIRTRHPGAREAQYTSAFVTLAGAAAALSIISLVTMKDRKLVIAKCDGILPVTFRSRPSSVLLRTRRYGIGLAGRLMLVERAMVDYGRRESTLYLTG